MTNEQTAEALDPSDVADVTLALNAAQSTTPVESAIEGAAGLAQGYSPAPAVGAAITAGENISISGVNADQSVITGTPQAVVAGSALAEEVVSLTSLPIVGAGTPTVQTTAQLANRFDGLWSGTVDSQFPTAQ